MHQMVYLWVSFGMKLIFTMFNLKGGGFNFYRMTNSSFQAAKVAVNTSAAGSSKSTTNTLGWSGTGVLNSQPAAHKSAYQCRIHTLRNPKASKGGVWCPFSSCLNTTFFIKGLKRSSGTCSVGRSKRWLPLFPSCMMLSTTIQEGGATDPFTHPTYTYEFPDQWLIIILGTVLCHSLIL